LISFIPPKTKYKRLKATIAGSIIIFMISFLVFCICAIDVGNTVTSRFKAQKITETLALYMTSYLASLPESERTLESLADIKERFESLYSSSDMGVYRFEIKNIEIKLEDDSSPKIKLTTETSAPTLFLRYTGFGVIKIVQTAYAKSSASKMPLIESNDKVYTFKSNEIITDKKGDDLKINLKGNYVAFAGLEDRDTIRWIDIGSMSNKTKAHYTISNADSTYDVQCLTNGGTFDFTNDPNKTLGLIQYVKIIKTPSCNAPTPATEEGTTEEAAAEPAAGEAAEAGSAEQTAAEPAAGEVTEEGAGEEGAEPVEDEELEDDTDEPVVTILNTVKIIRKKDF